MTTRVSEYQNDLGVKGSGQVYLKSVLGVVTQTSHPVIDEESSYLAQVQGFGQMYLTYVLGQS